MDRRMLIGNGGVLGIALTTLLCLNMLWTTPARAVQSPPPIRSQDVGSSGSWTPSSAPMPASLPNGDHPASMDLWSTSCTSASFCMSVGDVKDALSDTYALVETYSDGEWAASVLAKPSNADTSSPAVLYSVSCTIDEVCAAVGDYYVFDPSVDGDFQMGLLETLSNGVWTAQEAPIPDGGNPEVNMNSVSCSSDSSCYSIGVASLDQGEEPIVDFWNGEAWKLERVQFLRTTTTASTSLQSRAPIQWTAWESVTTRMSAETCSA